MKWVPRVLPWLALAAFCFVAAGCARSTTTAAGMKDKFEQVKNDMSEDEVEKLLGKTDKIQKGEEMPIPLPGNVVGKTWEEGDKMYVVIFKDGKVAEKKVDDKPK
jgi:hypothetical protein